MSSDDIPRSVGRVLDLLEFITRHPDSTLTDAADATDLTPTTALRYLRALDARGYVRRDAGGAYSTGPTMWQLTAAVDDAAPLERLIETTQPHLDALAESCGESAYLAIGNGRTATYVATCESARALRHVGGVGQTLPLADTAVGAALGEPGVPHVRTGAVEADITAISCGLQHGDVDAALSIVGPTHRLDASAIDAASDAIVAAAHEVNAATGHGKEAS